ncbi:S8 family serine peptidase, partial [Motilibacter sp. E257]|nr:S8 family serine peptidase [Motilibacter deserti]
MPGIGQAVVRLDARGAAALHAVAGVRVVSPDRAVTLSGAAYDPATDAGAPAVLAQSTGAAALWAQGVTGEGVDVAVLDTGVAPVAGLDSAERVVLGPDLSFDSQDRDTDRGLDGYGHGTHMAGLIAGRDADVADPATAAPEQFTGVAPGARVVSLKLGDRSGAVDVSQVIAGIDWVVQHRADDGLNVRVLNLSFGTDSAQSYLLDPLAYAAEAAWRHGLVVVAAAGNAGDSGDVPGLTNPAYDPVVLAVGATDTHGTASTADDTVAAFSNRGAGGRNPDVVAPGTSLLSLRVPGSAIDTEYGATAAVGERFFRGSGTSQAAAVVSGAAALLLSQRPELTPDQVKALLTSTAYELPGTSVQAQGHGTLDLAAAAAAATPVVPAPDYLSTGTGTIEGSRGSAHLELDGVQLSGEQDIFGNPVDTAALAAAEDAGTAWDGGTFNGAQWAGEGWTTTTQWAGLSWAGRSWAGLSWAGRS